MAKLHELLAVSKDRRGQLDKVRQDIGVLFTKKSDHFREQRSTYRPRAEGEREVTETTLSLQTTVGAELSWLSGFIRGVLDDDYRISKANQSAVADVVLENGETLATSVPATALLDLEKRCGELLSTVKHAPTLDPTKGFTPDATRENGVYVARTVERQRTAKVQKPLVLYPATQEHPAQTQMITEDEVVGTLEVQEWSGMLTPAEKASLLERIEEVRRAAKRARSRANEVVVDDASMAAPILDYMLFGAR